MWPFYKSLTFLFQNEVCREKAWPFDTKMLKSICVVVGMMLIFVLLILYVVTEL